MRENMCNKYVFRKHMVFKTIVKCSTQQGIFILKSGKLVLLNGDLGPIIEDLFATLITDIIDTI